MADVLVTENIAGDALDALRREYEVAGDPELWQRPDDLRRMLQDARALVVRNQTKVTAELIGVGQRLEIIGRAGAGLDNIDTQAASVAGIVVSYTPTANSISVAELTIGLMLALARNIPAAHTDTRQGGWHRREFTGIELTGKTLGIVGLGRIGALTASRATALGMEVVAYDALYQPTPDQPNQAAISMLSFEQLLRQADFITCHVPLTDQTRGMFDYERFCQMKTTARFINTSRGEVVEENGLIRALDEGRISGAALDVRVAEPPDRGRLCEMDNVILTPHIAAFTEEAQQRVVATICEDISAVLSGRSAESFFNFARPR